MIKHNAVSICGHHDDLTIFLGAAIGKIDYGLIAASPARIDHLRTINDIGPPQYSLWGTTSEHRWTNYFLDAESRLSTLSERTIGGKIREIMGDLGATGVHTIYTHNPWGEYGHVHHRWISNAVCKEAIAHRMSVWAPASVVYLPPEIRRWHFDTCGLEQRVASYDRAVYTSRMAGYLRYEGEFPSRLWTWDTDFPPPQKQILINLVRAGVDKRSTAVWNRVNHTKVYGL